MTDHNFNMLLESQRNYFASGVTLPASFRIGQLKKLKSLIEKNESDITHAMKMDLNRSRTESVISEILLVTEEIDFIIKNLHRWIRPKRVHSIFPLCWPGRSVVRYEPYGSVLILGPWNYPFMLIMSPLIGAICAGNCAIVKPSEIAVHTQEVICRLISENFPSDYIAAVKGDHLVAQKLLEEKFDYVFFTGGTQVAKIIMQAAAAHLTPVTLELGGKSPCIVDETANIDFAARRITRSKFLNAGQVCLAPDFLMVHQSRKDELIGKLISTIRRFYGDDPLQSQDYCRIINQKHFDRISALMRAGRIIFGGSTRRSDLYISPTLMDQISWDAPVMQEEIFGPLLPIITFQNTQEVIQAIKAQPKPLALYLFTNNPETEHEILTRLSFGGGCINDCVMHITNYHLPFGGVGPSGLGFYHGQYSFKTFSHSKSIFKKTLPIDVGLEYPPYSDHKLKWLRRLIKL
ncbi:Aldehyde dehydrogenase [Aquicella siphonis]|uniref:Aldehyde dehydrogenase n=2 Tax=Aquicella siphonis TaxID=254247 RepID=A0A5E4PLY1_9COXI|nr:Aldehyde dehydrogenase [Aquicella siphonis]